MATSTIKPEVDATIDWSGGMDTSRSSSFIENNQYVLGINTYIPSTGGGISSRRGFRCLQLQFPTSAQEDIYRNGNIQGEGWYFDGYEAHYMVSVDGYIFDFVFISYSVLSGRIRNSSFRNNPNNLHAWITRVPFGVIVNDGESSALYITKDDCVRTDPRKRQIGAGKMGVYVQNRFFYVLPDDKNIYASDVLNPISLAEAYNTNIFGFISPEDEDILTAIGRQKTILKDAQGGNLAFSTNKNNYSVDARGDRDTWGKQAGFGLGFVNNTVPDIGAVSAYSYEPFNGNIYFRNSNYGLLSTKQAQYQFLNENAYFSHSIEANLFFDNDSDILLSKCYTRGHKSSLYTTVAPQLKDNFIIHNGIIAYSPDIYYSSQSKAPRRFEGVFTGIRPWCITVSELHPEGSKMIVHSHDFDGVNRIYLFDESLDYDVDKNGDKKEIVSKILTRAYTFGNDSIQKKSDRAIYSLKDIPRNVKVDIKTRTQDGKFSDLFNTTHLVKNCAKKLNINGNPCFCPRPIHPQSRDSVVVSRDNPEAFFSKQDLFTIEGSFTLKRWVRISVPEFPNASTHTQETKADSNEYCEIDLFDYKISK